MHSWRTTGLALSWCLAAGLVACSHEKGNAPVASATTKGSTTSASTAHDSEPVPPMAGGKAFVTANGLVSVRHGDDYVARALDDSTIQLTSPATTITVGAIDRPLKEDPAYIAELFLGMQRAALRQAGARLEPGTPKPATCFGRFEGVATSDALDFGGDQGSLEGCFFIRDHAAVFVLYLLPALERAPVERSVASILGTMELHTLARPDWTAARVASKTENELLVAHHPSFYAASNQSPNTLVLRGPDRTTIGLSAEPVTPRATRDVLEKAFWSSVAAPGKGLVYDEKERKPGTCFGGRPGTTARGVRALQGVPAFEVISCFAIADGRAVASSIEVPVGAPDLEEAAMKVISETELARGS